LWRSKGTRRHERFPVEPELGLIHALETFALAFAMGSLLRSKTSTATSDRRQSAVALNISAVRKVSVKIVDHISVLNVANRWQTTIVSGNSL